MKVVKRATEFKPNEMIEVVLTTSKLNVNPKNFQFSEEKIVEKAIGYITDINPYSNKVGIWLYKSDFMIKTAEEVWIEPYGADYVINSINETCHEALYGAMDFALDNRDFDYARELHERMYA